MYNTIYLLLHMGCGSPRARLSSFPHQIYVDTYIYYIYTYGTVPYSTVQYRTVPYVLNASRSAKLRLAAVAAPSSGALSALLYVRCTVRAVPRVVPPGTEIVSWERGGSVRLTVPTVYSRPGFAITPQS